MGKDLKGKELGVGICQRKDGLYTGRFTSKRTGKSVQKYFTKLQDCRKWYADAVENDVILKNPVTKSVKYNIGKEPKKVRALTIEEQKKFLEVAKNSAYASTLFKLCDKAGIDRFSMHVLRHTMATRCIEGGMRPKTLQVILGHSNVGITMNLYVHVTEEEKYKEVEKIENALIVV